VKFRKKAVVIEAIQFESANLRPMLDAWGAEFSRTVIMQDVETGLIIKTLEGEFLASPGDWIIKGVKGEFYPCKPDVFEATYEAAE
jgi:hypothetical protein